LPIDLITTESAIDGYHLYIALVTCQDWFRG
jgi:hypothetical protein